ncbi:MAG: peptidylprolyl isomerase [Chitinophagaceae bacterium]|nr:peptidylprolyl isomerase [Chitinophagaceae bacterium]
MKKFVCSCLPVLLFVTGFGQTLFTYGPNAVSKSEFVKAFNKNPNVTDDRKQALKEYLDLYVNFKLKVKAAYDAKLQNEASQIAELTNFKLQIADNFINQEANVSNLVDEAFEHSQKDIHLEQVFIEVPAKGDTTAAYQNIQVAYRALQSGQNFTSVATQYSTDAYTKSTGGDLGFITVFTLPYEFEKVAYSTATGNYSHPFRSKIGYHIFKNVEERKPMGTRKVAHILVAYPPNGSITEKEASARKADSIYNLLKDGQSFENMARLVSNDISSAGNGGLLNEFGIGEFDPTFEMQAFSLKKPGDISAPFDLAGGYHLLQLRQVIPVSADKSNIEVMAAIQEKIQRSDRLANAREAMIEKHKKLVGYKPAFYNQTELWNFTDSSLKGKAPGKMLMNNQVVLFSFAKQKIKAEDWVNYVKATKGSSVENANKSYGELMNDYINQSVANYYRSHLEDYNKEYKQQADEFKDANLLFGIMDSKIWNKANNDTIGLKKHYELHTKKYVWGPSADAIIVTVTNDSIVDGLQQQLKNNPANWRAIMEGFGMQVTADSGRYELGQLPVVDRTRFEEGLITASVKNANDNSVTFNYIFKMHADPEQRLFEDAKGLVISDYQQELEDRWIAELKKKYPVKVNRVVFEGIK